MTLAKRIRTNVGALAVVGAGTIAILAVVAIVGQLVSRYGETELVTNQTFQVQPGTSKVEGWSLASDVNVETGSSGTTFSSPTGSFEMTLTAPAPFKGARGNWWMASELRFHNDAARVVYTLESQTLGQWKQLDTREAASGSGITRLVLEPRTLSAIGDPPGQLRVIIAVTAPPNTRVLLQRASLRTDRAGVFNSLNPPTWGELIGIVVGLSAINGIVAYIFSKRWRTASTFRSAVVNITLLVNSAVYTLIALEIITRTFLVFPDSMATTRVSELWWSRHWKPVNEFGFRDVSHTPEGMKGKKLLYVIGDSFTAGHGIARFEDTFSQRIARKLGPEWEVVVMAKPGLSTRDELTILAGFPFRPDAVIVAHVWNDVNSALLANNIAIPGKPAMISALRPIVLRSYFLDFVYWRIHGLRAPMRSYLDLILSAYNDGPLWNTHAEDLNSLVNYARQKGTRLLVVAFPALEDVHGSRVTSARVAEFFRTKDVVAIDFAEVFAKDDARAITVNRFDSHPNEAAHERIADEIYKQLQVLLSAPAPDPER